MPPLDATPPSVYFVTCNSGSFSIPTPVSQRVKKRRDALRAAVLRRVQIWVPDTRRPDFAEECHRQARMVAASDAGDHDLDAFLNAALTDL